MILSHKKWNINEESLLTQLYLSDILFEDICKRLDRTEESIRCHLSRLGIKRNKHICSEESRKLWKERLSKALRGREHTWKKLKPVTDEEKENISKAILANPKDRKRRSEWMRNYNLTKKDYSFPWNKGMKPWEWMKMNADEFYKMIFDAQKRKPTSIEKRVIGIIERFNLPYRYVGDGKVWINGKCPDFISTNGKKLLVELLGDYWHDEEETENRKTFFKNNGFDTLFIWESDLRKLSDEEVVTKLNSIP